LAASGNYLLGFPLPGNPLPRTTARSLSAFLGRCSRGRRGSRWTQVVGMLDVTLDADCHIDTKDTYCSFKIDDPLRSNLATWQYLALAKSQRLVIHPRRRPPRSPRAPSPATKSQSGVTNAIYLQSTHSPLRDESEKAAAVRCHRSVDRVAKHSLSVYSSRRMRVEAAEGRFAPLKLGG